MHRQYLLSQSAEQNSKLAEIDRQLAQKEAERDTIGATIEKLQATIPLLQERVDVRKYLYNKELGSKITYLTELQDLVGPFVSRRLIAVREVIDAGWGVALDQFANPIGEVRRRRR